MARQIERQEKEKQRERSKRWYEKNKEKVKESAKRWQEENPERKREIQKAWDGRNWEQRKKYQKRRREENPEKAKEYARRYRKEHRREIREADRKRQATAEYKEQQRLGHLRRAHGLSAEQYRALWTEQEGLCGICREELVVGKNVHVDHDHETGETRGLLCLQCNVGLGLFKDKPSLLIGALAYLGGN